MKKLVSLISLMIFLSLMILPSFANQKIMIVPIEKTVEKGLSAFVDRAYQTAKEEKVTMVILEINTPGGRVDAAREIEQTIRSSQIPTTALIKDRAISAGSFIALACDTIAMQPGSTMGDAELRIGNEKAEEKYLSDWRGKMEATAESKGRDPKIAAAFVDSDIEIPGVVRKGELLTLTPQKAVELKMADYLVENRDELLEVMGLTKAQIISAEPTTAERLSRFATDPLIAPTLLTIGMAGIIIELFTMGFGIFGIIGIGSLSLFFGGHLIAGFSGWGAVLLFLIGFILLVIEAFAPGFGVFGISGIVAIFASIIMVSESINQAIMSLTIAIIGSIILLIISFKFLTKRNFWSRLVLGNKLGKEEGYQAASKDLDKHLTKEGIAMTDLRPAGTAELDDGTRLDVVSSGEYIAKDSRIIVVKVEGNRIVVKNKKEDI